MTGRKLWGFALAAFCLAAFLFNLGGRGLNEPDEGRYAAIAREMAAGGDWLIPHLNGNPHFQKPPIIYWATALSFRCFGYNEAAARLPSALAALGILACTFGIARRLFDLETAFGAVLVLASAFEFFGLARMLTPDMVMSCWIATAIFCFVKHQTEGKRAFAWLFFTAMGLGFMTKGPMALVVPLCAAIAWTRASRPLPPAQKLPWLPGILLALALGLSWFIVISIQNHQLASYFAGYELVQRFGSGVHGRSKPFWFFGPVLLLGLLPWTPGFLALAGQTIQRWRKGWRPSPRIWLLMGWIIPPLIILSISGSKLLTYVLPLFPALAMAIAHWHRQSTELARKTHLVTAAIFTVLATLLITSGKHLPPGVATGLARPVLLMTFGLIVAGLARFTLRPAVLLAIVSVSTIAGWSLIIGQADKLNNLMGRQASVREFARQVKAAPDHDRATFFAVATRAHAWEFYLGQSVLLTAPESDLVLPPTPEQEKYLLPAQDKSAAWLEQHSPAYGVVMSEQYPQLFPTNRWVVLDKAGSYVLIATPDAALAKTARVTP